MTRRAFRPRVSAAAGAAPVISKAEGLPCCFGSIAVLIFSTCLSRARGGREARSSPAVEKIAALTARRLLCGSGTSRLVWPGGEKVPVPRRLAASPAPGTGSFQTARRIHPTNLLVKSIAQYIGLVFLTAHNRAGSLRFYMKARPQTFPGIWRVFLPRPTKFPAARPRGAGGSSRGRFFI